MSGVDSTGSPTGQPQGMRRWLPSLQARVLLATLAGGLLTLTLAGWLLNSLFTQHVQRQFELELGRQLSQLVARLEFDAQGQPVVQTAQLSDPRWVKPYGGLYWQINNAAHTPVLRSRSLWDQTLALPRDTVADGNLHAHTLAGPAGQTLRVLEQSVQPPDETDAPAGVAASPVTTPPDAPAPSGTASGPRWTLAVAADMQDQAQAVQALRGTLLLALAALLGLLGLAAAAQVWFGLAPLRAMRQSLADLNAGTTDRLGGNLPAEVQPLVDDFNRALQRLDDGLASARTQAGNLAHALKTPLAVLRQAADAAATVHSAAAMPGSTAPGTAPGMPPTPEQALHQLAAQVQEQVTRAQQHIDWHLRRARAAAHAGAHQRASCELVPVLQGLMRVMDKLHAKRALDMALHTPPDLPATVAVEAQDLHDMLGNLLDNACQWARSEVRVGIEADDPTHLCVVVEDDGPGIPAALRTQMLERGARLDETTPGSGLGLAIVTELAGLYGGALTLEESPLGGLCARLRLPAR